MVEVVRVVEKAEPSSFQQKSPSPEKEVDEKVDISSDNFDVDFVDDLELPSEPTTEKKPTDSQELKKAKQKFSSFENKPKEPESKDLSLG